MEVVRNADNKSQKQIDKPSIIDIMSRVYTVDEVNARFKEHAFRATNDFKNCRLIVSGKITSIGTVTFSKNPLVTLGIPDSNEGLKFIFENTNNNNDKIATLNIGDSIIIAGKNARPGSFGGVFFDESRLMTDMVSKKKQQMLVVNGGIFDREICRK